MGYVSKVVAAYMIFGMIVVIVRTQKGQKMTFCCCLILYLAPIQVQCLPWTPRQEGTLEGGWAQRDSFQGHVWRMGAQVEKNHRMEGATEAFLWLKPRDEGEVCLQHSRKKVEEHADFGGAMELWEWDLISLYLFIWSPVGTLSFNWHGKPRGKGLCQPSGCQVSLLEQRTGQWRRDRSKGATQLSQYLSHIVTLNQKYIE